MSFQAKNPDFVRAVHDSFNAQAFMHNLNAEVTKVGPGSCEIQMPFDKKWTQQNGFFHAGIVSTIADNAAGYAGYSLMEKGSSVLTTEFKLNLLSPGDGEMLIGRGHVLKYGKTLTVCRAEVFVVKNGVEKMCAASQATLIELK